MKRSTLSSGGRGVLRDVAAEVTTFDQDLQALAQDMLETMEAHDLCIGLAAPQVGVSKRLVVVTILGEHPEPLVMVNPTVVTASGPKDRKRESCMSLPGWNGEVTRREKVQVRYQDLDGKARHREFKSFQARIVAHEIDHLNGVLYADHTLEEDMPLTETDSFESSNFEEVQKAAEMS
jgi:peptide deformylase